LFLIDRVGHGRFLNAKQTMIVCFALYLKMNIGQATLPWEYAYVDRARGGDGVDDFLAPDPRVAIVRHKPLPAPASPLLVGGNIEEMAASLDLEVDIFSKTW
jgi:hypothetical protein